MNAREALITTVEALERLGFMVLSRSDVEEKDKEIAALRKALEQIEQQLDYGQFDTALRIARAVLKEANDERA